MLMKRSVECGADQRLQPAPSQRAQLVLAHVRPLLEIPARRHPTVPQRTQADDGGRNWGCEAAAFSCDAGISEGAAATPDAGILDSAAGDGSAINGRACSMAYECIDPRANVTSACCFDRKCVAVSLSDCGDAGEQPIWALNYDTSCVADSDCVAVAEGNGACPGAFSCVNAAIGKGSHATYQSDVAMTRGGSCYVPTACPFEPPPCCRGGKCHGDLSCRSMGVDAGSEDARD
jgi:hypothetical protein